MAHVLLSHLLSISLCLSYDLSFQLLGQHFKILK
jgi:hypothetical protein